LPHRDLEVCMKFLKEAVGAGNEELCVADVPKNVGVV
jgi:hypothetical protein